MPCKNKSMWEEGYEYRFKKVMKTSITLEKWFILKRQSEKIQQTIKK